MAEIISLKNREDAARFEGADDIRIPRTNVTEQLRRIAAERAVREAIEQAEPEVLSPDDQWHDYIQAAGVNIGAARSERLAL